MVCGLRWINRKKLKAYCIFSKAETQMVVPLPARPNYNGDPKKRNEVAPHQTKMLKF